MNTAERIGDLKGQLWFAIETFRGDWELFLRGSPPWRDWFADIGPGRLPGENTLARIEGTRQQIGRLTHTNTARADDLIVFAKAFSRAAGVINPLAPRTASADSIREAEALMSEVNEASRRVTPPRREPS